LGVSDSLPPIFWSNAENNHVQGDQLYTVFGEIDEERGIDIAEAILEE
jgi:hypothetical protein